jgi:hypothetical protein
LRIFYKLHQQLVGYTATEGNAVAGAGHDHTMAPVVQYFHLGSDTQSETEEAAGHLLATLDLHNTRPLPLGNKTKGAELFV